MERPAAPPVGAPRAATRLSLDTRLACAVCSAHFVPFRMPTSPRSRSRINHSFSFCDTPPNTHVLLSTIMIVRFLPLPAVPEEAVPEPTPTPEPAPAYLRLLMETDWGRFCQEVEAFKEAAAFLMTNGTGT